MLEVSHQGSVIRAAGAVGKRVTKPPERGPRIRLEPAPNGALTEGTIVATSPLYRSTLIPGAALAAAALVVAGAAPAAFADTEVAEPAEFTSAFTVMATPDMVVDADGNAAPGEDGATGSFTFRINSELEIICYDITLEGVTGEYESPARTATHIHEANAGEGGPPRIAFPNPEPTSDGVREASGCMDGPFTTGIENDGVDTGEGFSLAQIEANPAGFSADTHTEEFPAGTVRGQLTAIPVGGVDTGAGGVASSASSTTVVVGAAAALGAGGLIAALFLRRRLAPTA